MHRNRPLNHGSRLFIVLLVLSVAINGTQAVVLCLGSDGHVAIKLAKHQHCEHAHGSETTARETAAFTKQQDGCGGPCVDIPLSPGISDGPIVQKAPAMNVLPAIFALLIPDMADHGLKAYETAGACQPFISFHQPLSSIILIV